MNSISVTNRDRKTYIKVYKIRAFFTYTIFYYLYSLCAAVHVFYSAPFCDCYRAALLWVIWRIRKTSNPNKPTRRLFRPVPPYVFTELILLFIYLSIFFCFPTNAYWITSRSFFISWTRASFSRSLFQSPFGLFAVYYNIRQSYPQYSYFYIVLYTILVHGKTTI